jgi:hypothetical protein
MAQLHGSDRRGMQGETRMRSLEHVCVLTHESLEALEFRRVG